ncbi:antiviral reverse transcriptase Drt3a [Pseudomonas fluorescens]|uniref:antiviral reverse transcriptase Drt3a n=1 Tax=Pseudomonas fluorescens TaxID=294 RepID=UPI0030DA9C3A
MNSPTQDFTAKNLNWMRKRRKQFGLTPDNNDHLETNEEWSKYLTSLELRIAQNQMNFIKLSTFVTKKSKKTRTTVRTKSLDEALTLRKINDNLRRAYHIKSPSRDNIVKLVIQALRDPSPKTVYRLDIKSCFESIHRTSLMNKIARDGYVSFQTLQLLDSFFSHAYSIKPALKKSGLPRGVIITSTLAEIYLNQLDLELRNIPRVYLAVRYVDDIVIFATCSEVTLKREVHNCLSKYRLKANESKSNIFSIKCTCSDICEHPEKCPCERSCKCAKTDNLLVSPAPEYLGYKILVGKRNDEKENKITLLLSDSKISKLKQKIFLSLQDFITNKNIDLLKNRLSYLTGNQLLPSDPSRRGLYTGLAYTHSLYSHDDSQEATSSNSLSSLDNFFANLARPALRRLGISKEETNAITKHSFASGFKKRRRTKFSARDVIEITRCWNHV